MLKCFKINKNKFKTFCESVRTDYPEPVKFLFDLNVKKKKLPCFEVYSSQIEILNQPMDYYLAIIVKISKLNF
jgi:hypothetical protein